MRARVGDVELEYEVRGDGPELVWLHGLTGCLEESRPLCEELSRHYRVLWYSTRGHGRSTAVHERHRYRYDVIADDLQTMIEHVGFTRPLVGGGSHGANTAMRHALRHRDVARGLLLVGPGRNALKRPDRLRWALVRGHLALAVRRGDDAVIRSFTGLDPSGPLDAREQQVVAAARTHDLPSLVSAMRLIPDQQVVPAEALRTLEVPALVAAWEADPLIHPIAVARRIAALIPDAQFVEMPRPTELAAPEAAALMTTWLENVQERALP